MRYFYGEFDGQEFPTQDKLFGFDQLMNMILRHGEDALDALQRMLDRGDNDELERMIRQMLEEGMLEKDAQGRLRLTPRAVTAMQQKALLEQAMGKLKGFILTK